jgi:spermidine synthase
VVESARVSFNASEGWFSDVETQSSPAERVRRAALRQYFERGDANAARALWMEQTEGPRDLNELAMVADLEADAGSESALPFIERLRPYQMGEADTLLAGLRWKQGRFEDAATALESALVRLRTDPWPLQRYKEKALMLADGVGRRSPAMAGRMFTALRKPLALRALDDLRLQISATLAMGLGSAELCREAVGALDTHVPWDGKLLQLRRDCYRLSRDARLDAAERDFSDFISAEPMPLGAPVPSPLAVASSSTAP